MANWICCKLRDSGREIYINFDFVREFEEAAEGGAVLKIPRRWGPGNDFEVMRVSQTVEELAASLND